MGSLPNDPGREDELPYNIASDLKALVHRHGIGTVCTGRRAPRILYGKSAIWRESTASRKSVEVEVVPQHLRRNRARVQKCEAAIEHVAGWKRAWSRPEPRVVHGHLSWWRPPTKQLIQRDGWRSSAPMRMRMRAVVLCVCTAWCAHRNQEYTYRSSPSQCVSA